VPVCQDCEALQPFVRLANGGLWGAAAASSSALFKASYVLALDTALSNLVPAGEFQGNLKLTLDDEKSCHGSIFGGPGIFSGSNLTLLHQ
jgi:hypothetical protein